MHIKLTDRTVTGLTSYVTDLTRPLVEPGHLLVVLEVKASASIDSGFESLLRRDLSGVESY